MPTYSPRHFALLAALVAGVAALVVVVVAPDLGRLFRASVGNANPTTVTRTFTWTPDATTTVGDHTLTVTATDEEGNVTTQDVVITVQAEDIQFLAAPSYSAPSTTQIQGSWDTDGPGVANIDYDVSPTQIRATRDDPGNSRNTNHQLTIDSLEPCATYVLRAKVVGFTLSREDAIRTFTTGGCPGDASVNGDARGDIGASGGGTVELTGKISLQVPSGFAPNDATFQVHQLDRDQALGSLGVPQNTEGSDLSPVTGLYHLASFDDPTTKRSSFDSPISVVVDYTPADDTDTSTLALYRHDGTSWQALNNCSVDEGNQTVTCDTDQFSQVAGFSDGGGSPDPSPEPSPTPTPTPSPSGDSGGGGGGGGGGSSGGGGGGGGGGGSSSDSGSSSRTTRAVRPSRGKRSPVPLYLVNQLIREELGTPTNSNLHVNPPTNAYYVWRLQRRSNERGYIRSIPHIRAVMRYWKAVRPLQPYGEIITAAAPRSSAPAGSGSVSVAQINSVIRSVLGPQFVTPDIHSYYVRRVSAPTASRESIKTRAKLESVMRYWQTVRPARPRGD